MQSNVSAADSRVVRQRKATISHSCVICFRAVSCLSFSCSDIVRVIGQGLRANVMRSFLPMTEDQAEVLGFGNLGL